MSHLTRAEPLKGFAALRQSPASRFTHSPIRRAQAERLLGKLEALDDLYAHLIGVGDTPEKFKAG